MWMMIKNQRTKEFVKFDQKTDNLAREGEMEVNIKALKVVNAAYCFGELIKSM